MEVHNQKLKQLNENLYQFVVNQLVQEVEKKETPKEGNTQNRKEKQKEKKK